jgi:hypothetical protein
MELERLRLRDRAIRIRHALDAMRTLTDEHGVPPPSLQSGMTEFGRELERVEHRLLELDRMFARLDSG